MRTAGFTLLLLGATSFIFPMIGRRSMIMGVFGEHERIAAIASLAVGALVFALSFRKKKEEKK
ncbi:MAG TPA: hypothetical protein VE981_12295 [Planctomycetota bacterium]|nr:hypothetical protein [Planctomycetota bacterium]